MVAGRRQIAFVSSRLGFKDEATYTDAPQPYGELFVMRADGTNVQQLTDNHGKTAHRVPADRTTLVKPLVRTVILPS